MAFLADGFFFLLVALTFLLNVGGVAGCLFLDHSFTAFPYPFLT